MEAIRVHETAFMTAYLRSKIEAVSLDPYSQLWLSERTKSWVDEYLESTSPTETIFHALRNRFFYEQMLAFSMEAAQGQIINLGAGFSMYPYLLPSHLTHFEVDQAHTVQYKSQMTAKFEANGQLPHRNITRLACDLTKPEQLDDIFTQLAKQKRGKTFILIEGVFFYLNKSVILDIIRRCASLQEAGDYFCCVSFQDEIEQNPVYQKLAGYFIEKGDFVHHDFTNLPHSFYQNLAAYKLQTQSSVLQFGNEMGVFEEPLIEDEVLNEYLYVLRKLEG